MAILPRRWFFLFITNKIEFHPTIVRLFILSFQIEVGTIDTEIK
ncbi:hypothetical protein GYO_0896 [Bacillus spizizenii TU-B-10]|uniref:Uncharacterized protein n=1 Tax=Bacillus spizizenii (strain DSM 15029 / JCM 12233 / NBRC 101239 / NRRL B-23049 / TU-B-10) TaxID=1052585 RepID=G4NU73_BACS4|nr:hypothetical protein GYO_0896 [Bacillus spizizenii TU-B-10]SCV43851.1 hypothetical protein BQ1740_3752 [Bacillus subtilis]